MLNPILATLMALVSLLSSAQQSSPEQHKPNKHESITEDLSHGASFKFKIAPDLPEFIFKVIPEPQDTEEDGNPHTTVREVQVFRGDSKEPTQSLEDCEFAEMEAPPKGFHWFRADDVNFDGYADIFVMTTWGATGNQFGCVWLYDPRERKFDYNKDFTEIAAFEVHPETKTLTSHGNGGMAGTVFRAAKYIVENNRPVPLITVAQDWDMDKKQYHCVIEQRRGGKLVKVRDVWAESKGEFGGPCDPSEPFSGLDDK